MNDCLFCKIISKQIKSNIVHDGKLVLAFSDVNPQAPHHMLVIPKRHINSPDEASKDELAELFSTAAEIAKNIRIKDTGYRIVINQGPDAGQAVPHLHLHIIGGRKLNWPPG